MFGRKPRPPSSGPCATCHGSGRMPFTCACCGHALAHRDALCGTCLDNEPPCYEQPGDMWRFSPAQMNAYAAIRITGVPA